MYQHNIQCVQHLEPRWNVVIGSVLINNYVYTISFCNKAQFTCDGVNNTELTFVDRSESKGGY
jgi:hypothetical protein